jgi:two-component system cell cycle response regulator DivK
MNDQSIILYIEDNIENRLLIKRILEAEGYQVLVAGSTKNATRILNNYRPNLILMDINMPDMDGYLYTSQIKQIYQLNNVPIIAVTANVMKGDRERAIQAGCDGYVQKPIDIDSFPGLISEYINSK